MNRIVGLVWGLSAMVLLAGCSTVTVHSDFDQRANFASYRTFAFISEHPMIVTQAPEQFSPLTEGRFMDAISASLRARGLRQVDDPESADIAVSFTLGAREKIRVDSYPTNYRAGYGSWGWGRNYYQDVRVSDYTQGQFALDLFEVKSRAPVWHGRATKTITSGDRDTPAETINEIVTEVLAEYPPS